MMRARETSSLFQPVGRDKNAHNLQWVHFWGMSPYGTIILVKEKLHHSYTFWTMPFLIFGLVQIIMRYLYVLLIFGTFHSFLADLGRNWGQQHINKFILVKQTRQQALTVLIYIYVVVGISNSVLSILTANFPVRIEKKSLLEFF
jgi:hypothetical protein